MLLKGLRILEPSTHRGGAIANGRRDIGSSSLTFTGILAALQQESFRIANRIDELGDDD